MARRKTYQKPEPYEENGQWKIKYRNPVEQLDGSIRREQRTKCLGSVAEMNITMARKERDRFLQPINDVVSGIEHTRKTMQHLIARWKQGIKPNLKYSTQCSYEWAFKRIEPAFNGSAIATVGRADVQAFLTDAAKSLSPESLRDLRARLRGLLSTAVEWGWLQQNPAVGRLRLPEKVPVRPRIVLWPEQFWALVAQLRQPYRAIVIVAVLAGLRRGELAALRWRDNAEPGKLLVDEAVYFGNADEERGQPYWRLDTPKTPKSKREATLGPVAQRAIDEWRSARWPSTGRPMVRFTGPNDFMFAIRTNTPIDLHTAVARYLQPAAKAAGVPAVSWHDLRHTYTTWGGIVNVRPEVMRDQLGHSSVLMTLDVYSHVNQAALRAREIAKIEQYATAKPKTPEPEPAASGGKVLVFRRKVG